MRRKNRGLVIKIDGGFGVQNFDNAALTGGGKGGVDTVFWAEAELIPRERGSSGETE